MGKHAAADGSSVDPLIADALTHRPTDAIGAHRDGATRAASEGGLGWPGEPPVEPAGPGSDVGWPEPAPSAPSGQERSETPRDEGGGPATPPVAEPAAPAPRRGWRRLLAFSA